jgi:3-hydroxy acid dehydrogenase/malonic semialdehyde reductase
MTPNLIHEILSYSTKKTSLKNKTALVTGASAGIGLATSVYLAKEGVNLILVARRYERLQQLEQELKNEFPNLKITILAVDLLQKNALEELNKQNAFNVDIFINNAGVAKSRDFVVDLLESDIDDMVDTNIKCAFKLSAAVAKKMVQKGSGHIIHLGSIAGNHTYEGGSIYCATKFAVRAFSQTMRQELYDKNVRVSLISPRKSR